LPFAGPCLLGQIPHDLAAELAEELMLLEYLGGGGVHVLGLPCCRCAAAAAKIRLVVWGAGRACGKVRPQGAWSR